MQDIAEGRTLTGKYRLERELGGGAMGAVWIGFDTRLRRRVVVKFLRTLSDKDPQMVARFEREARAAARVRSPHVIETYDYGIDRGRPFIIMEYLEGEDLNSRLTREQKLAPGHAAAIAKQMGKALDAVHAAGIVHRDLKPSNVFLMSAGDEDFVKLLDFGIAKAAAGASTRITQTGVVLGTPRYMSPEQTDADAVVDYRTDLWAFAVILYRSLTGLCPFFGTTMRELIHSICHGLFPRPSEAAPELPPALDLFFARAFAPALDARFQSGKELVHAFHAALQEPLSLRGPLSSACPIGGDAPFEDRKTLPGLSATSTLKGLGDSYFRLKKSEDAGVSGRDAETLTGPVRL